MAKLLNELPERLRNINNSNQIKRDIKKALSVKQ